MSSRCTLTVTIDVYSLRSECRLRKYSIMDKVKAEVLGKMFDREKNRKRLSRQLDLLPASF